MQSPSISGKVIRQIGYLRLGEGLLEDADDLLQESLEISDTCSKIPTKATIHYYVGLLRYVFYEVLRQAGSPLAHFLFGPRYEPN